MGRLRAFLLRVRNKTNGALSPAYCMFVLCDRPLLFLCSPMCILLYRSCLADLANIKEMQQAMRDGGEIADAKTLVGM